MLALQILSGVCADLFLYLSISLYIYQSIKVSVLQTLPIPLFTLNNRIPSSSLLKREKLKTTVVHSVCTQSFGKYNYSPSRRL